MIYQNSFRYGEISRKNAGRFDTDAYTQGAFTFRNARNLVSGGFTRRPPLRTEHTEHSAGVLALIPFPVSETLSYMLGLTAVGIALFRFVGDTLSQVSYGSYPDSLVITEQTAREISYAQYYERMYLVHQSFYPMTVEINTSTDSFNISKKHFIFNQDIKNTDALMITPSYILDGDGERAYEYESVPVWKSYDSSGNERFYTDIALTCEYPYADTYRPEKINPSYITGYDSYPDENLLSNENNYPGVVAIISDSLYFANTKAEPMTIWKSRFLGSSQWILDYSSDSLHDFTRFQMVTTSSVELKDADEFPMTKMIVNGEEVYYQENGNDIWYAPIPSDDPDYSEDHKLTRIADEDGNITWEYTVSGASYNPAVTGAPIRRNIMQYDLSDASRLITTETNVDYVTTDSCGCRFELNTGRMDKVQYIVPACERILVGTSSCEQYLPSAFSAVSNLQASHYSDNGSLSVRPVVLNKSFFYIQKGNIMREMYLNQGYLSDTDLTVINRDIFDGSIISMSAKNNPEPVIYVIMDDGTMRVLSYEKNIGIQAFGRWDFGSSRVISAAVMEKGYRSILMLLVERDGERVICSLDEDAEEFLDFGTDGFDTVVETTYAEIIDQRLAFGRHKRAKSAWLRPYRTGKVYMGNDTRQLMLSNYALGDEDYRYVLAGRSSSQFSLIMKSHDANPMTILTMAWEED